MRKRRANISEQNLIVVARDMGANITSTLSLLEHALTTLNDAQRDEYISMARHNLRGMLAQVNELQQVAHN